MSAKHEKIQAFLRSLPPHSQGGDPRYLAYFQCFNNGLFYEAHDVLEDLWLEQRHGPRHPFYKGLIQLAGAFVHLQKNRLRPASALFNLCQKYLSPFKPTFKALNVTTTCFLAQHWNQLLVRDDFISNPLPLHPAPQIHLDPPPQGTPTDAQSHARILIFCKAPRPGLVKTRIAASVGHPQALEIYQQLLLRTVNACYPFPHVTLAFTPSDPQTPQELTPYLLQPEWQLKPQTGENLGDRLIHSIESSLSTYPQGVLVVGSDCPELAPTDLAQAWQHLNHDSADVVLGPAADGGYWLIGLKHPHRSLFEGIAWSTNQVLSQTLERCHQAGLEVHQLRVLEDIDTHDAWQRWQRHNMNLA